MKAWKPPPAKFLILGLSKIFNSLKTGFAPIHITIKFYIIFNLLKLLGGAAMCILSCFQKMLPICTWIKLHMQYTLYTYNKEIQGVKLGVMSLVKVLQSILNTTSFYIN